MLHNGQKVGTRPLSNPLLLCLPAPEDTEVISISSGLRDNTHARKRMPTQQSKKVSLRSGSYWRGGKESEGGSQESCREVKPGRTRKDFSGGSQWVEAHFRQTEEHEQSLQQEVIPRQGRSSILSNGHKMRNGKAMATELAQVWRFSFENKTGVPTWVSKKGWQGDLILSLRS